MSKKWLALLEDQFKSAEARLSGKPLVFMTAYKRSFGLTHHVVMPHRRAHRSIKVAALASGGVLDSSTGRANDITENERRETTPWLPQFNPSSLDSIMAGFRSDITSFRVLSGVTTRAGENVTPADVMPHAGDHSLVVAHTTFSTTWLTHTVYEMKGVPL